MVYMHLLNQGRSNNFIDILNCFQDTFNATIINSIIDLKINILLQFANN